MMFVWESEVQQVKIMFVNFLKWNAAQISFQLKLFH